MKNIVKLIIIFLSIISLVFGSTKNINVGNNTSLKGAVIASGSLDENGNFIDNKNLNLTSKTITYEDIKDKDKSNSYNVSLGYQNSQDQGQKSIELGLNSSNKEQTTYATIGQGDIDTSSNIENINRDVNSSQVITKDEDENLDIYLSNTSISKALNMEQTVAKWVQDAKDLGLTVRKEILRNIPSAKKLDENGEGNILDKTVGAGLDYIGEAGLLPSVGNQGGYVTQIASEFFGDNRGVLETKDKQALIDLGISEQDIIPTTDGKYITNPNKTVVILENQEAIENEKSLSNHNDIKIYLTQEQVKNVNHMATGGILNDFDEFSANAQEQTGNPSVVFKNYNQTHGLVGDLIESTHDKIFVDMLGQDYLLSGSARQTGDYLLQLAQATNGDLTVAAHSQGTLLTYAALKYLQSDLQTILKDSTDTTLKVGFYGSPVNSDKSSTAVKDIYKDSQIGEEKLNIIDNYFRSSVNPGDPVGSISFLLGGNGAGINNPAKSDGESFYVWFERGIKTMFNGKSEGDLTNSSPHSGYVCVIGCSDSRTTPIIGQYVDTNGKTQDLNNFYDDRDLDKGFANFNQGKTNENK